MSFQYFKVFLLCLISLAFIGCVSEVPSQQYAPDMPNKECMETYKALPGYCGGGQFGW